MGNKGNYKQQNNSKLREIIDEFRTITGKIVKLRNFWELKEINNIGSYVGN